MREKIAEIIRNNQKGDTDWDEMLDQLYGLCDVGKCIDCGKNHAEMCGSCVQDIAQGTAEQALDSMR